MENTISTDTEKKNGIFKLGALECVSSSLINALVRLGRNHHYFLINYWNLEYMNQLLLGSKNINLCFVPYIYQIKIINQRLTMEQLASELKEKSLIIVKCMASQLSYFPKQSVTFEDRGLGHTFLIYGMNEEERTFSIIDAMADLDSTISFDEVAALGNRERLIDVFNLKPIPDAPAPPPANEIVLKAAENNYRIFTQKVFNFGSKAIRLFRNDIEKTADLGKTARDRWITQNTLAFSVIMNNRSHFLNSLKALDIIPVPDMEQIETDITALRKEWKSLIFLFIKYQTKSNDPKITGSICERLDSLSANESAALKNILDACMKIV